MVEKIRISEEEREDLVTGDAATFPKYTTQLMNTANQNSQATRPKVVGSMNEISQQFRDQYPDGTFEDWVAFYYEEYDGDDRLTEATEKTYDMVQNMSEAMGQIDRDMVQEWIEDLVLYKTYLGFDTQEAIFRKLADEYDAEYSQATIEDESQGIDGYLDGQPVSIKPETYKQKAQLQEDISAPIVYYEEYSSSNALMLDVSSLDEEFGG
jgi:hypothetical protein